VCSFLVLSCAVLRPDSGATPTKDHTEPGGVQSPQTTWGVSRRRVDPRLWKKLTIGYGKAHHQSMGTERGKLRDPAAVLTGIARRHRLRAGMVIIGLVELPDTIQQLLDTTVLALTDRTGYELRHCAAIVRDTAERLFGPRVILGPPRHSFLTVIVRSGPLDLTAADRQWLDGWRESGHGVPAFDGQVILLTELGWRTADDKQRGYHPTLA
jgi:hypothetical protein